MRRGTFLAALNISTLHFPVTPVLSEKGRLSLTIIVIKQYTLTTVCCLFSGVDLFITPTSAGYLVNVRTDIADGCFDSGVEICSISMSTRCWIVRGVCWLVPIHKMGDTQAAGTIRETCLMAQHRIREVCYVTVFYTGVSNDWPFVRY